MEIKFPLPPFTHASATQKIRLAEDAWNTRDPEKVALVYTENTIWRNRAEFPNGREELKEFLRRKWERIGIQINQGALGIYRKSYCGSIYLHLVCPARFERATYALEAGKMS